jgi:hypothetical protein
VLFLLGPADLSPAATGDRLEDRERELPDRNGLKKGVAEVAELEKQLDLCGLSRFTPKI